jgi:hypothetical protein
MLNFLVLLTQFVIGRKMFPAVRHILLRELAEDKTKNPTKRFCRFEIGKTHTHTQIHSATFAYTQTTQNSFFLFLFLFCFIIG